MKTRTRPKVGAKPKTSAKPKTRVKLPLPSKQYTRDIKWIGRHYRELSLDYANKWIAVHKGHVVTVGDDMGSSQRLAEERTGALEIPVIHMDGGAFISLDV